MYAYAQGHAKEQYLGVCADRDLEIERGILFIEFHKFCKNKWQQRTWLLQSLINMEPCECDNNQLHDKICQSSHAKMKESKMDKGDYGAFCSTCVSHWLEYTRRGFAQFAQGHRFVSERNLEKDLLILISKVLYSTSEKWLRFIWII